VEREEPVVEKVLRVSRQKNPPLAFCEGGLKPVVFALVASLGPRWDVDAFAPQELDCGFVDVLICL
jgi:hypothetical protein